MTTVIVQPGTTPVVVEARPSTVVATTRPAPVTVQGRATPVTVRTGSTPVQAVAQATPVLVGNNIGRRGPRGPAGDSIAPINFGFGDAPADVWTAESAGVLTVVRLQMRTPFDGAGAAIHVGLAGGNPEAILAADQVNPYSDHEFEVTPDLVLAQGDAVRLAITPGTASAGAGTLFLSFIPT